MRWLVLMVVVAVVAVVVVAMMLEEGEGDGGELSTAITSSTSICNSFEGGEKNERLKKEEKKTSLFL